MYLQHCEPNSGCKNLEREKYLQCVTNMTKMCREKVTQKQIKPKNHMYVLKYIHVILTGLKSLLYTSASRKVCRSG